MVFGVVAVVGLTAAAMLHVYWALGGIWPGSDRTDLARKVVGSVDEFPSAGMTFGVAGLLLIAAVLVGAAAELWTVPLSDGLVTFGAWGVALVLLVRSISGFWFSGRRRVQGRDSLFSVRDLTIYSPFTLVLSLCTIASLLLRG